MKSGLRDRNNGAAIPPPEQQEPEVSMKSGLGDRNNLARYGGAGVLAWESQ